MSSTNLVWQDLKPGMYIMSGDKLYYTGHLKYNGTYRYLTHIGLDKLTNEFVFDNNAPTNLRTLTRCELLTAKKQHIKLQIKEAKLHYTIACYIGCDPEVFAVDKEGKLIPAWTFLPPKEEETVCINAMYWDGFQAEFITDPTHCAGYAGDYIHDRLQQLIRALPKGASLTCDNVVQVPDSILQTAEDKYVTLGCMPSKNAYGAHGAFVPDPRQLPFRFAGGHIHLGTHESFAEGMTAVKRSPIPYVKAIDAYAGMASVALFDGIDNPIRRQFYGLAGEYRTPKHGLEYRVLSNAWLMHPALTHWAYDSVRAACQFARHLKYYFNNYSEERIQNTINKCDVDDARLWIKENQALYDAVAISHHHNNAPALINKMYTNGAGSVLDMKDIKGNWRIGKSPAWVGHSEGFECNFTRLSLSRNKATKAA